MNSFLDEFIEVAKVFYESPLEFRDNITEYAIAAQEKIRVQMLEQDGADATLGLDLDFLEELGGEEVKEVEPTTKLQVFV